MKSSYKRLGDYIQPVNSRNKDLIDVPLLGVSIKKVLMPSIANIIGTDMSTYKLISKNQFAYGPVTSRNGDKISIALLEEYEKAMVSQAYTVFEVIDENKLLPEYLMMWFRRPEFDRYARFKSHGSAREIFDWAEMCDTELPIPSPEKQQEIVREYNIIQNRIVLNNQLITKLEETAQAIYKQWFVDFEFPYVTSSGVEMPYKSNGGEMVWCEELEKEIPEGWEILDLETILEKIISKRGKSKSTMNLNSRNDEFKIPVISAMNVSKNKLIKLDTAPHIDESEFIEWMSDSKLLKDDFLLTSEAPLGELYYVANENRFALSQRLYALRTNKEIVSGWYLYLNFNTVETQKELENRSSGTTVSGIKLSELKKIKILIPSPNISNNFINQTIQIPKLIEYKCIENQKIEELKGLLLAKMTKVETEKEIG